MNKFPDGFHLVPEQISTQPAIDSFSSSYERKEFQVDYINKQRSSDKPYKTAHTLKSCIEGYFEYIEKVALEDFIVEFKIDNKQFRYEAKKPNKIVISNNLFRAYSCLDLGCSRCCHSHGFHNIFSEEEYKKYLSLTPGQDNYNTLPININGSEFNIKHYSHAGESCQHLELKVNGCSIHQFNPIHCAFPLMKFKRVKGVTFVTREYFGRNWNMKCPAKFQTVNRSGFDYTMFLLNRVLDVSKEFNIKTDLPRIIQEASIKYQALLNETTIF